MNAPRVDRGGLTVEEGVGGGRGGKGGIAASIKGGEGKDDDDNPTLPPVVRDIGRKEVLHFPLQLCPVHQTR